MKKEENKKKKRISLKKMRNLNNRMKKHVCENIIILESLLTSNQQQIRSTRVFSAAFI
jgi:hypothetical protein